jgi:hypothetical protein
VKENWVAAKPAFNQSEPTETSTQPGMDDGFQALVHYLTMVVSSVAVLHYLPNTY